MILFTALNGLLKGYIDFPNAVTDTLFPKLAINDNFGSAIANYSDIDNNGQHEIIVGAPGDSNSVGAVYILFPRRRRYHKPVFDYLTYYLLLSLPFAGGAVCCCCLCLLFCYYFRRKKTEVEVAIQQVGVETGLKRKRHKHKKREKKEEYADSYD